MSRPFDGNGYTPSTWEPAVNERVMVRDDWNESDDAEGTIIGIRTKTEVRIRRDDGEPDMWVPIHYVERR